MNPAYHKLIQDTSYNINLLLATYAKLSELNILWAGSPNYQNLITQSEINSDPNYLSAGLTTQNVADAEFALAQIKTQIDNAMVALTILSNLP